MIDQSQVTACLVTRGDQPDALAAIIDSLIFDQIVVWDNSVREDKKCAGRYYAITEAETPVIWFQDDDVIVPPATQLGIVEHYQPGMMVANYGHGDNPDGYDDLPLVGCGAIVDRDLPWEALNRYLAWFPEDDNFLYEADFIAGVLYQDWRHVMLPVQVDLSIAQSPERLCNQPWQRDLKFDMTERARAVRDGKLVAA